MRLLKSITKLFRIILVKFKKMTIHVEAIVIDDVWEEIQGKFGKIHKWYVMTPANYEFTKAYFNLKINKTEFEKIMKQRYLDMIRRGEKLQLHIHLHPTMKITYEEQEKLISKSIDWFKKELKLIPKEIVFGWWRYNQDTIEILRKYKLKLIKFDDYNSIHDYDLIIKCKGESYL